MEAGFLADGFRLNCNRLDFTAHIGLKNSEVHGTILTQKFIVSSDSKCTRAHGIMV